MFDFRYTEQLSDHLKNTLKLFLGFDDIDDTGKKNIKNRLHIIDLAVILIMQLISANKSDAY